MIQTERIGPFLDGSVRVIEGRGYAADGAVASTRFGIISFDPVDQPLQPDELGAWAIAASSRSA